MSVFSVFFAPGRGRVGGFSRSLLYPETTARREYEMAYTGRRVIYSDVDEITDENVFSVLANAISVHTVNSSEIEYLYKYYKGDQPVLNRTKEFRENICSKIVENRANEIVTFKVGYLMGEPVTYINRGEAKATDEVLKLNSYMFAEDKAPKDKNIEEWAHICGTAYRMVLPNDDPEAEAPFRIYVLDPRNTFVIYHSGIGHRPLAGVHFVKREDGTVVFSVYTRNMYYEIWNEGGLIIPAEVTPPLSDFRRREAHIYGGVPIIEYPLNEARLGAFEIVLPILDAINLTTSNRVDGVEQFVQAILAIKGMSVEDGFMTRLKEQGGLQLPENGDAFYITQELNQTQTQTLVDYMAREVLLICGMPNRNGSSSTSDTGSAVIMRDGWGDAEARAKDTELMFDLSEKKFLALALNMANAHRGLSLKVSDIGIKFTRRNYENIVSKANVLVTLLNNEKVHPRLAWEHSGLAVDPEYEYTLSEQYYAEQEAKSAEELERAANAATKKAAQNV